MWKYSNILIFLALYINSLTSERVELEQERHKIIIPAKTESCFFISNLVESDIVSLNYLVISFSNGKQHDITFRLKDPETSRYQNMHLLLDLEWTETSAFLINRNAELEKVALKCLNAHCCIKFFRAVLGGRD